MTSFNPNQTELGPATTQESPSEEIIFDQENFESLADNWRRFFSRVDNRLAVYNQVRDFSNQLEAAYQDSQIGDDSEAKIKTDPRKSKLFHLMIMSTPPEGAEIFDYPGEFSIVSFMENLMANN